MKKDWPSDTFSGKHSIKYLFLAELELVLLSQLHNKLDLMKNLVKALNNNSENAEYFKSLFPNLGDAKLKDCIFVGSQIVKDKAFETELNATEFAARKSFGSVDSGFLGN